MDSNEINYNFIHKVDEACNNGRNIAKEAVKYFRSIVKAENEKNIIKNEKNKGIER